MSLSEFNLFVVCHHFYLALYCCFKVTSLDRILSSLIKGQNHLFRTNLWQSIHSVVMQAGQDNIASLDGTFSTSCFDVLAFFLFAGLVPWFSWVLALFFVCSHTVIIINELMWIYINNFSYHLVMPIPLIIHIEFFFVMLHGERLDSLVLKAFSE